MRNLTEEAFRHDRPRISVWMTSASIEAWRCQTVVLNAPREAFAVVVPSDMGVTSLHVVAEGEYELLTGDPQSFATKKVYVC